MDKRYAISAFLFAVAAFITLIGIIPFNTTEGKSVLVDGYNITFEGREALYSASLKNGWEFSNNSIIFGNFGNVNGWAVSVENTIHIFSGVSILRQYTTCIHEKIHIDNGFKENDHELTKEYVDDKIIPPYNKTCVKAIVKGVFE